MGSNQFSGWAASTCRIEGSPRLSESRWALVDTPVSRTAPARAAAMLLLGLILSFFFAPPHASAADPTLIAYTTIPGAQASTAYTLRVNGQPVFVERFGEVNIARFAFTGVANVELTASSGLTNLRISPRDHAPGAVASDRTVRFALRQPRKLILQSDGQTKLLLFADGPEQNAPRPGQPGVISLETYLGATRDPNVAVTTALQRAIDETSASNGGNGGVLFVPSGLYMATQLRLKSNVHLYLESGARIRSVPIFNSGNYPIQHGADSSFIYIADASNVRLSGRGVIDGNGFQLRSNTRGGGNNKLLRTKGARGVVIEDLYFRDSARWSLHFLYSDDVLARNVKLVNDLRVTDGTLPFVTNTDGFDIDSSTFVTVEDSFVYTTDDAFTPKVTGYMGVQKQTHDVFIRRNVIWTQKCALKVGDEVLDDMYGIHFDDNDVVLADRFIALWNIGTHTIRDIRATHNRTETIGVRDNKSFFYYYVRNQPGHVRDIEVNGLQALSRAPAESRMEGFDATHRVSNFAVRNMYVAGVAMNAADNIPLVKRNAYVANISVTPPGADGTPLVQVTAPDDYAIEGADDAHFRFSRTGSLSAPLTVRYTVSGTATAGSDYVALGSSITFPANEHQVDLALNALRDASSESEETVVLSLVDAAGYRRDRSSSAVATIAGGTSGSTPIIPPLTPPPPPPIALPVVSVVVEDGSSSEATSPANTGRFRIARTGPLDQPLNVLLSYSGTATNGADYMAMGTAVTIPAGADRVKLLIVPKADGVAENHEKVLLSVLASSAYQTGTAMASLTLLNVNP